MRIATKLNVGILMVFLATVIGNGVVLDLTIRPKFVEMEATASRADHQRVLDVIHSLADKLRASSQDNAYWDEPYAYARGETGDTFITNTYGSPAEAIDALGIEVLAFMDARNSLLWGKAFDLGTKQEMPNLVEEISSLKYHHPYLSGTGELRAESGLISTSSGLMMLAVAPIVKNDRSGAPAGTVWMATRLKVKDVEQLTGVGVRIDAIETGTPLPKDLSLKKSANVIETTSLVRDITGRPLALLATSSPRNLTLAGDTAIRSASMLLMFAAAMLILAIRFFVQKLVVTPVGALKAHFAATNSSGKLSPITHDLASDEIGELGRAFNAMEARVSNLRDALSLSAHHANNAYVAGMAEWAAGTLHNIRNGLSPINMHAWKIQQLYPDARLKKLRTAIAEIETPETPDERKGKLTAFIVANASVLIDTAEKTKAMTDDIVAASRGIEAIASEYENFSRQETTLEQIDLAALVEEVAKVSFMSHESHINVTLPTSTAVVVGNVTILRQVLSNLFLNAVEAMSLQTHGRRIRIDLRHAIDVVELSVTDSGDGITAEHLKSMFQRGFSTRTHKRGGLGLHWCSRAVKSLGGTLRAESEGRGKGATFVVVLPTPHAVEQVAA
ncbi:MAG: ATP-binding protein [Hyphomicrobium sp.]